MRVRLLGSEYRPAGFRVACQVRLHTDNFEKGGWGDNGDVSWCLAGRVRRDPCKDLTTAKGALCGNGASERVRLLGSGCPLMDLRVGSSWCVGRGVPPEGGV